jgi:hypothetical protein
VLGVDVERLALCLTAVGEPVPRRSYLKELAGDHSAAQRELFGGFLLVTWDQFMYSAGPDFQLNFLFKVGSIHATGSCSTRMHVLCGEPELLLLLAK